MDKENVYTYNGTLVSLKIKKNKIKKGNPTQPFFKHHHCGITDIQKIYVFKVYNLVSFAICI